MNEIKVVFVEEDEWNRKIYKNIQSGKEYVEVDGKLFSMTQSGEPLWPIGLETHVTIVNNDYERIYSVEGLEGMIQHKKETIYKKKVEREDIGHSWTQGHIAAYQRTIDREIDQLNQEVEVLEEALLIKRAN